MPAHFDNLETHLREKLSNVRCMSSILGDDCLQHSLRSSGSNFLGVVHGGIKRGIAHEVNTA